MRFAQVFHTKNQAAQPMTCDDK